MTTHLAGMAMLLAVGMTGPGIPDETHIAERARVSAGDTARLQYALARARRGDPVVVAVIGGSITEGASASTIENRWANQVAAWWREAFPETPITFINAGIGATGSDIGVHRAAEHLLVHQPDVVIIEFAVNDRGSAIAAETLEGLVRQILKQHKAPAVLQLFTMDNAGVNTQEAHVPVGLHYGLPMVSFRDALWPEVEAGRIAWEAIEADEVHPNDRGHAYCAQFVNAVFEETLNTLPEDAALSTIPSIPPPLHTDRYEFARFKNADALSPTAALDWTVEADYPEAHRFGPAWKSNTPGSVLEFTIDADTVGIFFYRIKGPMGRIEATVNEGSPVTLDGWFNGDWGGYTSFATIASELGTGLHTLRIRLLDIRSDESDGHEFIVQAIALAGRSD